MKLETFDGKRTSWGGLWWHPESMYYTSGSFSLAKLKAFKGNVRLLVRKNKFYNGGENGRPNYVFIIVDSNSDRFVTLDVEDDERRVCSCKDGKYYDENGKRLYTEEEARAIINGTFSDVKYGIGDPYDILPEDFV